MLDQKTVKELLHYDPETGIFMWRKNRGRLAKANNVAGCVHKKDGRVRIKLFGTSYLAHRLAWIYVYGTWPKHNIDHIDHNPRNNRIKNLRDVTKKENNKNQKLHKTNKSGFCGVHFEKESGKWVAQVRIEDKQKKLGRYKCLLKAVLARKKKEKELGYHKNHGKNYSGIHMRKV